MPVWEAIEVHGGFADFLWRHCPGVRSFSSMLLLGFLRDLCWGYRAAQRRFPRRSVPRACRERNRAFPCGRPPSILRTCCNGGPARSGKRCKPCSSIRRRASSKPGESLAWLLCFNNSNQIGSKASIQFYPMKSKSESPQVFMR